MIEIACRLPFDLALCQRVARGFASGHISTQAEPEESERATLRLGVWLGDRPTRVDVRDDGAGTGRVTAISEPAAPRETLERLVRRVVNADMDLMPFYERVSAHPVLGPLTRELPGLKPLRPASLFDMLVMAVTEQQISLAAAHHMQTRLVERFGTSIDGLPVFPRAAALADASIEALTACGLSVRKAEYIQGVARAVVDGSLDLEELESAPADEVRDRISSLRGFGRWSADYILVRGLAHVDVVPYDDLAIRRVVGRMLSDGHSLTTGEAEEVLVPFSPFRGLTIFYLLVGSRLASS